MMFDFFKKKSTEAKEDEVSKVKPIPYDNNDYGDNDEEETVAPLTDEQRQYLREHSDNPISQLVRDTLEQDPKMPPPLDEKKN